MFPHGYFAAGYFAPGYFPPAEDVTPPTITGRHAVRHRSAPVADPIARPFGDDDDFLMFFT